MHPSVRRIHHVFGRLGTSTDFPQGTASDSVEQLAELTLTTGISTYVLGADDAQTVARSSAEVAPGVRSIFDRLRRGLLTVGAARSHSFCRDARELLYPLAVHGFG